MSTSGEDMGGLDNSGKERTSDENDIQNKAGGSTLDVLSSWYQDGESESNPEVGERPGDRVHSSKESEKENIQSAEHTTSVENLAARDSRSGGSRDKAHLEHRRKHKRRWDEPDDVSGITESQVNYDSTGGKRERTDALDNDSNELKKRDFEVLDYRAMSREDDGGNLTRDDMSSEGQEEHSQQRNSSQDVLDTFVRSSNADQDSNTWDKDKTRNDLHNLDMYKTPEKDGRHPADLDSAEMECEKGSTEKRRDSDNDGTWDDRPKNRDESWSDRGRDRDYNDNARKRKQDMTSKNSETTYDNVRDWELPRRGRDRVDSRPGGRKDGNRTEAVKASSKYGISNENYDVIEIQTRSSDYGKEVATPTGRDSIFIPQSDGKLSSGAQEFAYSKEQPLNAQGSGDDAKDNFADGDIALQDHFASRDGADLHSENMSVKGAAGQSSSGGSQPPPLNHDSTSQGARMNRIGRVGRDRPAGRDSQQSGTQLPLAGPPFGALGFPPPVPMQTLPPNMSPAPGAIPPSVFVPPFQSPMMWSGACNIEMNMMGVPPGLPQIPSGPMGPRFSPSFGYAATGPMNFNQSGPGRGVLASMPVPNYNPVPPLLRNDSQDRSFGGRTPPGKAPSRGEQNDYSQNFVDTGMRPQNFIRELELTSVVEDYPKLRELIQKKDEIVSKSASHPMCYKCDLREQVLSPEFFGTKFDVILVDPPWEEYVHRAPGVTDHMEHWTFEEIMNLKIEAIADTPSFIFFWVGAGVGLEQGRQCLKKWGFRRCEDICWVKTNKTNAAPGLRHDSHTLFQRSKEHCLMGIKGTVRRSTDGHIIHANIDTDVIIAEEPPYGSTAKPEDMYRIIEHFALGRRRLELFGEDHNIRAGWLTVGKGLSSSNFNAEAYVKNFADKDGKVWVGGGGCNPPPEAPHLVLTTPDIEALRPKSPVKNQHQQQQQQHQSSSISLTPGNSNIKRSPPGQPNQEGSSSNVPSPAPWGSPMEAFRGREGGHMNMVRPSDNRVSDVYGGGYNNNAPFVHPSGELLE